MNIQLILIISTSLNSNNRFNSKSKSGPHFQHGNLTTGNKLLWKRGEIAPFFCNIFNRSLQESKYILINEMWVFDLFFPQFCKSDMSRYGDLEVESPLDFKITRVNCRFGYNTSKTIELDPGQLSWITAFHTRLHVCQQRLRSTCTSVQFDQSLCRTLWEAKDPK